MSFCNALAAMSLPTQGHLGDIAEKERKIPVRDWLLFASVVADIRIAASCFFICYRPQGARGILK